MTRPTVRSQLGARLKEYRIAADLSGHAMAAALGTSQASVSRIEAGKQRISAEDVHVWLDAAHALSAAYAELTEMAERADVEMERWRALQARGWEVHQRAYEDLEREARTILLYQPSLIPGLLQSHGYIDHLMRRVWTVEEKQIGVAVDARLRRQQLLYRPGTDLDVIVTEAVLRHAMGGYAVMAEQLRHMAGLARLPTVNLGVIPIDTDMPWPYRHSYVLCDLPDGQSVMIAELVAREVRDTDPETITRYRQQHAEYRSACVSGEEAIRLVEHIAEEHTRRAFEGRASSESRPC